MPAEERPNDRIGIERAGGWPEEERVGRTTRPGVAATVDPVENHLAPCPARSPDEPLDRKLLVEAGNWITDGIRRAAVGRHPVSQPGQHGTV